MERDAGKRVLLCADYLPPSDGGVEQVVQKLARHLTQEGFEVGVYTLDDEEIELEDDPRISVFRSSAIDLTGVIGLQSMFSVSALWEFGRVLEDFRPDIVHAHNRFFYTSVVAALYSIRSDVPLVVTLHLGDIGEISGLGGLAARAFEQSVGRFVVSRADHVIGVSGAAESVGTALGARETSVIRNAVDVAAFAPSPTEGKSLLYIGRLVHNNGIQDLIEALPGLLDDHPDAEVHIVGSGPLESEIDERIRELGIDEAVTMHGFVDDISELYDRASVFCRPSYSEGLPLTLLEAMASGVVPVVTPIAGVPEVVDDGETGLFVETGSPMDIEAAIGRLFADEDLRGELSRNGREYVVENLSWEQRAVDVIERYLGQISKESIQSGGMQ